MLQHVAVGLGCLAAIGLVPATSADELVHEGMLSGSGEPDWLTFTVPAFDDAGGTLRLDYVRFEVLTSVIGGYQTTGSGQEITIHAELVADYYAPGEPGPLLVATRALVHSVVFDGTPAAFTVFDNDVAEATIDDTEALAAWLGTGNLQLDAFAGIIVWEDPEGIIGFGAGGSARWTVAYGYTEVGCLGDATGDGTVDIADLLSVLESWGDCVECSADLDGDGTVGVADLLIVLGSWGCAF